jgi:4-hydroxybenzoate polyprenyltransferase
MLKLISAIAKTSRPRQWIKNLSIFGALVFTGQFFEPELFNTTLLGFFALSLIVSAVYFINDIADRKHDQLHPFKSKRPIAKGDLPVSIAIFVAVVSIIFSLMLAKSLSNFFYLSLLSYLILQIAYTFYLKEVVVIDILAIATGFILRVYAGAFLIDAHLSIWFLLCVVSVSLFLASGKRRAEFAILDEKVAAQHRKTLSLYSRHLLDSYLAMFATASWLSWALFTFFKGTEQDFYISQSVSPELLNALPLTILGSGKLLMVTIPIVIFGVMRYLRIVYEGSRAETPERVLLTDKPLLAAVFIWVLVIFVIIYQLNPAIPHV